MPQKSTRNAKIYENGKGVGFLDDVTGPEGLEMGLPATGLEVSNDPGLRRGYAADITNSENEGAIVKRMGLALGLGLTFLGLCGCAHEYVMKLSNGTRIVTPSKPKLENGMYRYKDAHGQVNSISQSRVMELEPLSMAEEENKFAPAKPEKSHWWKFW